MGFSPPAMAPERACITVPPRTVDPAHRAAHRPVARSRRRPRACRAGTGKSAAQLLVTKICQSLAQEAAQRHQIDQVLQVVVLARQRLQQPLAAVVAGVRAEPVGLVVSDVPAAAVLEGQVDKAFEKALEAVEFKPRCGLAQRCGQPVGRVGQQGAQAHHVQLAHREGEAQLRQPARGLQAGEGQPGAVQIGLQHPLQLSRGDVPPVQGQAVGLERRLDQLGQLALAPCPVLEDGMQTGTGPSAAWEGEEAAARLAGIGHRQGVAVRRFHVHAGGQPGEAADAPGAVEAAVELRQLLGRRCAAAALGAGLTRLERQAGHAPVARGDQPLDGQTQATAVETSQVVAQLRQWLLARQFAAVQQPGQGAAVQAFVGQAAILLRLGQAHRPQCSQSRSRARVRAT